MPFTDTHRANLVTARRAVRDAQNAARLEDVAWFVETGENLTGAAKRLGLSFAALDRWAHNHCPDLQRILRAREPHDPNQRPGIEAMRGKRWTA